MRNYPMLSKKGFDFSKGITFFAEVGVAQFKTVLPAVSYLKDAAKIFTLYKSIIK